MAGEGAYFVLLFDIDYLQLVYWYLFIIIYSLLIRPIPGITCPYKTRTLSPTYSWCSYVSKMRPGAFGEAFEEGLKRESS